LTPLLLAGAILVLTTRRISRPPLVSLALFVLTVGFIVASIARQSASGPVYDTKAAVLQSLTWVVLCVVAWLAFFRDQPRERLETLKVAVCFAPAIYVAFNVALHAGGLSGSLLGNAFSQEAGLLSLLGIQTTRVTFPLANSPNNFGVISGLSLTICVVLMRNREPWIRRAAYFGLAVSLYGLLRVDTRSATVLPFLAVALVTLRSTRRFVRYLPFLIPVSPFLILGGAELLASSPLSSVLERGGGGSVATASNRLMVWTPVLEVLRAAPENLIFGYGGYGHIGSGASVGYAHLFPLEGARALVSPHNFTFATLLDSGVLALAVVIALLYLMSRHLSKDALSQQGSIAMATLAALAYFILAGFTESTPTVYGPDGLAAWLMLLILALRLNGENAPRPAFSHIEEDSGAHFSENPASRTFRGAHVSK